MCVKLLGDIMDLLYVADTGSTFRDITEIMLTVMRTVIQTTIAMNREGTLVVSVYHDDFFNDNRTTYILYEAK